MTNSILVKDKYFKPFIKEAAILERINEIAAQIKDRYEGKRPIFLAVLNGSFMVASDLVKSMDFDCEITFTSLSSYQSMASSGEVQTLIGLKNSIENRHIIIVEDIIDSGRTMHHFLKTLQKEKPASVAIFTLLYKPNAIVFPLEIDYIGFEIDNKFVIGYGLDYDEYGRQYRDIYQLDEK